MPNSYQTEVATKFQGMETWNTNSLSFATKEEAIAYGHELLSRWTAPHASRAVESANPVNYRFDFAQNKAISLT